MIFKKNFGQLQQQIKYSTNSQSNILDLSNKCVIKKTIIINNTNYYFILPASNILYIVYFKRSINNTNNKNFDLTFFVTTVAPTNCFQFVNNF
jgi:hypothetical protein